MILPLEQQTTTLETSRRLKELGVTQSSLFYWRVGGAFGEPQTTVLVPESDMYVLKTANGAYNYISAYTASEVGMWLPEYIGDDPEEQYALIICKGDHGGWAVVYKWDNIIECMEEHDSLSEAMGLMLIYLLENKIVSIEGLKGK